MRMQQGNLPTLAFVCMQRRQQSFSYPVFFHFAIRLCGSSDQKSGPVRITDLDLLRVPVFFFQEPVIKLLTYCFPLVVEFIDVPRTSVRYAHYRPEGLRLALAFMGFILGVAHLSPIVIKDLGRGGSAGVTLESIKHTNRFDLFESLRGFLGAGRLDFWHDDENERCESGHVHTAQVTPVRLVLQRGQVCHKTLSFHRTSPTSESSQTRGTPPPLSGRSSLPRLLLWGSLSSSYVATLSSRTSSSPSKPSNYRHPRLEIMDNQAFELSHRESAI